MLNELGCAVWRCWYNIPIHFPHVQLDTFVLMPNHVHGVVNIVDNEYWQSYVKKQNYCLNPQDIQGVGVENFQPLQHHSNFVFQEAQFQHVLHGSLSSIVRGFKIGVTKWSKANNHALFQWQRNFHDRIIRTEQELINVREYIKMNPVNWDNDIENKKSSNIC